MGFLIDSTATARVIGYGVITAYSAEFQRVPGLMVVNPLARAAEILEQENAEAQVGV